MGIVYKHSRPYHPQTCGKIERWHQTLKSFLAKQPRSIHAELQAQVDRFVAYYNEERPHRAGGARRPWRLIRALEKAHREAPSRTPTSGFGPTGWTGAAK